MESQREVTRKYNKILETFKRDNARGINTYRCNNEHVTVTKDVDAGVTPFIIGCPKCDKEAKSSFYKEILPPLTRVDAEWYRPALKKVLKMRNNPGMLEHILNGGLELRFNPLIK